MTPETNEHLDKAREYLVKARNLLDVMQYNDEAGRAAYLAAFHAAQALISERTGKTANTHEGVNSQFNLLTRGDERVDAELRRFLSQAYNLKAMPITRLGRSGSRRLSPLPLGFSIASLVFWPRCGSWIRRRSIRLIARHLLPRSLSSTPGGARPGSSMQVKIGVKRDGSITAAASVNAGGMAAGFSTQFCVVEVDPETGKVTILRFVAAQDVGCVIHPSYVEGQIQGGVAQGTMIEPILVEVPNPAHPYGDKGVGEVNIVPPMAAIANAIDSAIHRRLTELPMSPPKIRAALDQGQAD